MIAVEKVRRWVVCFDCFRPLESLPYPAMLVGETEGKGYRIPQYHTGNLPPETGGQLTLTLAGRGRLTAQGRSYELTPGTAFLYRDRDPGVAYFTPPDADEPWQFVWINFKGAAAEKLIGEINEHHGFFFNADLCGPLAETLSGYRRFAGSVLSISPLEGAILTLELLNPLCRFPAGGDPARLPGDELARRIRSEVNSCVGEPLSTAALARKMGVSREHLSKTFHEKTGQTFRDYRARRRLQEALTLLRKSNMSCKEIALCCRYGSYSSFYRAFRKNYRISPEAFRISGPPAP